MTFLWMAIVQPVFKPVHLKNWIVYLAHLRLTQGMAFMRMAIVTSYSLDFLLENDGPFLTSPNTQKIELLGRISHIRIDTHHQYIFFLYQKGLQQCNQSITGRKCFPPSPAGPFKFFCLTPAKFWWIFDISCPKFHGFGDLFAFLAQHTWFKTFDIDHYGFVMIILFSGFDCIL